MVQLYYHIYQRVHMGKSPLNKYIECWKLNLSKQEKENMRCEQILTKNDTMWKDKSKIMRIGEHFQISLFSLFWNPFPNFLKLLVS